MSLETAGVWQTGVWATTVFADGVWREGEQVLATVPDVVGQTEANATAAIEAESLVVAVEYANSSVVASGSVISQDPAASNEVLPNSTVTITVSLGPAAQEATGGWAYFNAYNAELQARKAREKRRKELLEELEGIEDEAAQEIAVILHEDDDEAEQANEKDRLRTLIEAVPRAQIEREFGERVAKAYERAHEKATYSALEALVREAKRAEEEEEFLMISLMMVH